MKTITEIAKRFGVTNRTIHRWIKKHDMPFSKAGHAVMFDELAVDEWLRQGGTKKK